MVKRSVFPNNIERTNSSVNDFVKLTRHMNGITLKVETRKTLGYKCKKKKVIL